MEKHDIDCFSYYLDKIGCYPVLSNEESLSLFEKFHNGDSHAREMLIVYNLKLVVKVAKEYKSKGVDLEDLINIGNIGLIKAVDSYDSKYNIRFSTYAYTCIKNIIVTELGKTSRTIRIPLYMHNYLNKFREIKSILNKKLMRKPSLDEIAKELDLPLDKVLLIDKLNQDLISCDFNEYDNYIENCPDEMPKSPEDIYLEKERLDEANKMFEDANLTDIQRQVLLLKYGLYDTPKMERKNVAKMFNKSNERIRQIENDALTKLAWTNRAYGLVNDHDDLENLNKVRSLKSIKKTNK